jgi:hypothetical protein
MDNNGDGGTSEHELFRYSRGMQLRIYLLRVEPGGTELWRITEEAGEPTHSIMETSFSGAEEAAQFIDEVERTLTAGGWRRFGE